ncbi:MAG: (2Fe-2S)-binding protein [Hydrogenovibrio sp.]|nr:(2Fe-2S)-binding protein [Hydrogenovibrio sp.]
MKQDTLNKLPEILKKDLDSNLCVCNEVIKADIIQAIESGAHSIEEVRRRTYASDGNGCCQRQIQRLLDYLAPGDH